jgi:hypothetical protein
LIMRRFIECLFLTALIIITMFNLAPIVSAQKVNLQYQGEGKPLSDEWPPTISIQLSNGTNIYFYSDKNLTLKDNESLNLSVSVSAGQSPDGRAIGLFDVSYNASWLNYPIEVYHWNGNPANYTVWADDGPQYFFNYNLTLNNIPKGNQQIELKVISIGMYIGIPNFSSFKKEETMTLDLDVGNANSPTNRLSSGFVSIFLILLIFVLVIAVVIIGLLYRGKKLSSKKSRH